MAKTQGQKKDQDRRNGRDPETGKFRPADPARKKRSAPSDEDESPTPASGKLGRAHD